MDLLFVVVESSLRVLCPAPGIALISNLKAGCTAGGTRYSGSHWHELGCNILSTGHKHELIVRHITCHAGRGIDTDNYILEDE